MNKFIIFFIVIGLTVSSFAQNTTTESVLENKKKISNFHLAIDMQTNYQYKGVYAYVMGGYSLNGKYSEVDMGVSYNYKWVTLGINDYYYPTTTIAEDRYFNYSKNSTDHWLEGFITISPEKVPAYLTISNFFYGADKNLNGKQAYSTYIELGTGYDFFNSNRLGIAIGAACNESCYNGYEKGFGICTVELKYTHNLEFKNGCFLPLNVAYIINPVRNKTFVNFSTSFAF